MDAPEDAAPAEAAGTAENPPAAPRPPEPARFVDPDEETIDPEEHARLVALYEGSLKNIAEGEVIKGTVLKVSDSEVIVDVGYKSEGLIPLSEFYGRERRADGPAPATRSTCCSSGPRIATATSCFRARRPRR